MNPGPTRQTARGGEQRGENVWQSEYKRATENAAKKTCQLKANNPSRGTCHIPGTHSYRILQKQGNLGGGETIPGSPLRKQGRTTIFVPPSLGVGMYESVACAGDGCTMGGEWEMGEGHFHTGDGHLQCGRYIRIRTSCERGRRRG